MNPTQVDTFPNISRTDGARGSVSFGPNQGMVRKPNIAITRGKITRWHTRFEYPSFAFGTDSAHSPCVLASPWIFAHFLGGGSPEVYSMTGIFLGHAFFLVTPGSALVKRNFIFQPPGKCAKLQYCQKAVKIVQNYFSR